MEIVRSKRTSIADELPPSLPLYSSAPNLEVRLDDFELYAIDRLRVLKGISDGLSRGKKPEEMEKLVGDSWRANMRHQNPLEIANKDIISHFVLRLVYCRSEELRKWFLSMETTLFRHRYRAESYESQRMIMSEYNITNKAISHAEYESVKDKLVQVARSVGQNSNIDTIFFKVPFEEVPDLVANRRVFIHKGYAYVAMNQVASLLVTHFRCNLSKALVLTNRKWTSTIREQERDRLTPIVEALSTSYLGPDYSQPKEFGEISLKDIEQLASSSFPLCMRHLFEKLREDHHLKHGGRMQLGLFLKGVGLKLDDALAFWKAEFSQKVNDDVLHMYMGVPPHTYSAFSIVSSSSKETDILLNQSMLDLISSQCVSNPWPPFNAYKVGAERFDKEYAYSIRHNYGKEGKRTDYTPYSCQKIISSTPSVGDHHGCPYRHFSEENLRAALGKMGIGGRALEDVMDKVRNRHYQLACTLTFEAIHATKCDGINHPNQYFSESRKILQPKYPCVRVKDGREGSKYYETTFFYLEPIKAPFQITKSQPAA